MKITLALLTGILLVLFPGSAYAFTEKQAAICLELAQRQAEMYEAKINSDWRKMYSLFTPDLRRKISLSHFIASPHKMMEEEPKNISGAKTLSPENKTYLPVHLGYRFKDFYISKDSRRAKIVSRIAMPNFMLYFKNVLYFMDDEYWVKIGGEWYSQLDVKIIAHLSGATTEVKNAASFENATHVKAGELAGYFAQKASKLPPGAQKSTLIQNALLADVFSAVKVFGEKKIDAGNLPDEYLRRQIMPHPTSAFYYPLLTKAARWFASAGNYELSYEYYLKAHKSDGKREDALVGAAMSAIKLGSFEEGVQHYIEYLKIISILPGTQPETLGAYIKDACSICPKILPDTKIALARQLVGAQKWELAFAVYRNILESHPQWRRILAKLESGALVKQSAMGKRIAGELHNLTFREMQKMLQTAGYALFHSADFSPESESVKGEIILESVPKIARRHYDPNFMSTSLPARALVELPSKRFSHSSYRTAGYVAALLEDGKPTRGGFYPDNIGRSAGNSQLIDEIKNLAPGAKIFLARISTKSARPDGGWLEALASIGVETTALQKEITAHVVYGVKSSPPDSARAWNGFYAIRKALFSPTVDEKEKSPGTALIISKSGVRLLKK